MLTKIDIMDPGTNCRDVLEGQTYQLRNGWIGVVNRGQADINSKVRGGRRAGCGQRALTAAAAAAVVVVLLLLQCRCSRHS